MTVRMRGLMIGKRIPGALTSAGVLPRVGFQAGSFHHKRNS